MTESGLIHGESRFPVSYTLIVALLLLLLGVAALVSITLRVGPFR
jgi:putative membrane protein